MTVFSEGQLMTEIQPKDMYDYLTGLVKQAVMTYFKQEHIEFDAAQLPIKLLMLGTCVMPALAIPLYACCARRAIKSRQIIILMIRAFRLPMLWLATLFCNRASSSCPRAMSSFQMSLSITTVHASIPT